jgi:hypothetical protein
MDIMGRHSPTHTHLLVCDFNVSLVVMLHYVMNNSSPMTYHLDPPFYIGNPQPDGGGSVKARTLPPPTSQAPSLQEHTAKGHR